MRSMPKGYEAYEALIAAAAFYFLRNVLGGMGSGTEPAVLCGPQYA